MSPISEGTASSQRILKDVAELKRLAEAATPGPWRHEVIDPSDPEWGACEVFSDSADSFVSTHVTKEVDAVYIAAANPAAILELLAQRDELLAALRRHLVAEETPYPSSLDGEKAQDAWAAELYASREAARAAIAKVTP